MSAPVFEINSAEDARKVIDLYSRTGFPGRALVLQATLDRRICHFEAQRSGCSRRLKVFLRKAAGHPTLILLGDDDDEPSGPDAWPCARRLLSWANVVVLHATGAERWHYETTVTTAELRGRVLMVECCSATLPAWFAATRRWSPAAGVQILKVRDCEPSHPVSSTPETVQ